MIKSSTINSIKNSSDICKSSKDCLVPLVKTQEIECHNVTTSLCATRGNISLCSWNLHGLTETKLLDDMLGTELNKHDVIIVSETWSDSLKSGEKTQSKQELLINGCN